MRTPEARVPVGQLVRASASVAANYRASCRAKSKPDFIAKLGTVIEESDESLLWLEYLVETGLVAEATVKKHNRGQSARRHFHNVQRVRG
jgi:four helix bundle protein